MKNKKIHDAWRELRLDDQESAELYRRIEESVARTRTTGRAEDIRRRNRRFYLGTGMTVAACLVLILALSWLWPMPRGGEEEPRAELSVTGSEIERLEAEASSSLEQEDSAEASAAIDAWQPGPNLKPYRYDPNEPLGDGAMGFEGFSYPDRASVLKVQFNRGDDPARRPTHLPIFHNLNYVGNPPAPNENTGKEEKLVLFQIAQRLAAEYEDQIVSVYYPEPGGAESIYEVNAQGDLPTLSDPETYWDSIFAIGEKYNYLIHAGYGPLSSVKILLKEPVKLPEGLTFSPYVRTEDEARDRELNIEKYEENKAKVLESFDYLFKNYATLFNFERPEIHYDIENYSSILDEESGETFFFRDYYRPPELYESSGADLTEQFVQRSLSSGRFQLSIPYGSDTYYERILGIDLAGWREKSLYGELNVLFGIEKTYPREGLNIQRLGDYPLRTEAEAREALLRGEFRTSYPFPPEKISEDMIVKCELAYKLGYVFTRDFVPYYKFYIEYDDNEGSEFKTYSPCYVPAISPDYLEPLSPEDSPLFNG